MITIPSCPICNDDILTYHSHACGKYTIWYDPNGWTYIYDYLITIHRPLMSIAGRLVKLDSVERIEKLLLLK